MNYVVPDQAPALHSDGSPPTRLIQWFDFYGVRARVESDDVEVMRRVRTDFHFFRDEPEPRVHARADVSIKAWRQAPNYDRLPELTATVQTPRNICYSDGDITYLDYFGKALGEYRRTSRELTVCSDNTYMLHEIAYLTLLSRVGELLDDRGLHRLHALAVGGQGKSALFMMDSGGGKTSLALQLLRQEVGFKLISEDTPLITRRGMVLPFPLRLGVLPPVPDDVPKEHVYFMERMEFAPKYLISLEAFEDQLAHGAWKPDLLFIGRRRLGNNCVIREAGRWAGFKSLLRQMVVGVGIYQGLEFLLRSSPLELMRSSDRILSRQWAAFNLLRRSRVFVIELGRDGATNATRVVEFLDREGFGSSRAIVDVEKTPPAKPRA